MRYRVAEVPATADSAGADPCGKQFPCQGDQGHSNAEGWLQVALVKCLQEHVDHEDGQQKVQDGTGTSA